MLRRGLAPVRRGLAPVRALSTLRAAFGAKKLVEDASQHAAVADLEAYSSSLRHAEQHHCSPVQPWAYLWGGVGSGKTMLLDLLHGAEPGSVRVHFHDFMLDVHRRLHALQQTRQRTVRTSLQGLEVFAYEESGAGAALHRDSTATVARALAAESRLLCLDELQIADPADAVVFATLAEHLLREASAEGFESPFRPAFGPLAEHLVREANAESQRDPKPYPSSGRAPAALGELLSPHLGEAPRASGRAVLVRAGLLRRKHLF